ncbi:Protein of unknown function (DUF2034) domain containing protein [Amanita muscaria]
MRPPLFHREWCRHIATTTVHRGIAFEERSMKLLQDNLSMSLQRVGGREDGGIDLQGWWWLPPSSVSLAKSNIHSTPRRRLRIIAQCKAEKKKIGPKYVRELEGVMLRFRSLAPNSSLHDACFAREDLPSAPEYPLVALLVSESPFTKSTLLRAHSSPLPLFLLHVPPLQPETCQDHENEDEIHPTAGMGSAFWNSALGGPRGVLEGEMEIRWERSADIHGRPGIWWRNRRLDNWVPDNDIGHTGTKHEAKLQQRL